jgi:hypothetical protein
MRTKRTCAECGEEFVAKLEPKKMHRPEHGRRCSEACRLKYARRRRIEIDRERFQDRFWLRVDMSGGADACWPWTGRLDRWGYGMVRYDGQHRPVSRVAHILRNGPIDGGLFACHHCDNPACCNPAHIYAGTHQDNMDDRFVRRGMTLPERRAARG